MFHILRNIVYTLEENFSYFIILISIMFSILRRKTNLILRIYILFQGNLYFHFHQVYFTFFMCIHFCCILDFQF